MEFPVLRHILHQRTPFCLRNLLPSPLAFSSLFRLSRYRSTHAGLPSPFLSPFPSSFSPILPTLCCSPRCGVLRSTLKPGKVALRRGYCGCYPWEQTNIYKLSYQHFTMTIVLFSSAPSVSPLRLVSLTPPLNPLSSGCSYGPSVCPYCPDHTRGTSVCPCTIPEVLVALLCAPYSSVFTCDPSECLVLLCLYLRALRVPCTLFFVLVAPPCAPYPSYFTYYPLCAPSTLPSIFYHIKPCSISAPLQDFVRIFNRHGCRQQQSARYKQ